MRKRPPTSGSFAKGSARARAGGRKSKRTADPVQIAPARQLLMDLQNLVPGALEKLGELVKDGDQMALKLIVDRCLPSGFADRITSVEVATEIAALKEQNQELLQRLAELETPVRSASGKA